MSFFIETIIIYVILYLIYHFGKNKTKKVIATIAIVWSILCTIASFSEPETFDIAQNLALNLFVLFISLKARKNLTSGEEQNKKSVKPIVNTPPKNPAASPSSAAKKAVADNDDVSCSNVPVGDCICNINGKIEDFEITIQGTNGERFRFKCKDGDIISHMNLKANGSYINY